MSLWDRLEAEAKKRATTEPAHDFSHVQRVVHNARIIARAENVDEEACATAALLHELFTLPKSDPKSSEAGDICAQHARALLEEEGAPPSLVAAVEHAIRDHAFSKGVVPDARVSQVLQDADRLDALGAIGLARMWATCADMKRPFYAPLDPFCESREPNDKEWGLDHVYKKLLKIPAKLHTPTARKIAAGRVAFIERFVAELATELSSGPVAGSR